MAEGLFARLYLDEDVDVLLARLLTARGFDVTTTHEAGLRGASDASQLAHASDVGRVLVTHNRVDFERISTAYAAQGWPHAGMIVLHRRDPYELARRLLLLLDAYTASDFAGTLRYA